MANDRSVCFEVTHVPPRNQRSIRTFRICALPPQPHNAPIILKERGLHNVMFEPNNRRRRDSYIGVPTRIPHSGLHGRVQLDICLQVLSMPHVSGIRSDE